MNDGGQLKIFPSGLTRSQFNRLADFMELASSFSVAQLSQEADRHLENVSRTHLSSRFVNIRLAQAIRDTIREVVAQWERLSPSGRAWLAGAFLYFAKSNDDEPDLDSPIGFEDDAEVLNACLRFARLDDLCLRPEDYDDV